MKNRKPFFFAMLLLLAGSVLFLVSAEKVFAGDKNETVWRMVSHAKDFTEADAARTAEIYSKRLINLGIKENEFVVLREGKMVVVKVKNIEQNPDRYFSIVKALTVEGHLAFWETFRQSEALPMLYRAFDDKNVWLKFMNFFRASKEDSLLQNQQGPRIGFVTEENIRWVDEVIDSLNRIKKLSPNLKFGWCEQKGGEHEGEWALIALKAEADGGPALDKPVLLDASLVKSKYNTTPEISMVMDSVAAVKWEGITYRNIDRSIAIVYDGKVISYPSVNGRIEGGRSNITGNFTLKEAAEIVTMLKTEPLPSKMFPKP